jgi:hypothetical protein
MYKNDVLLSSYEAEGYGILFLNLISDSNGGILAFGTIDPIWGIYGVQVNKYGVLGSVITSVKQYSKYQPSEFTLFQNYPNPFNSSTIIEYDVTKLDVPVQVKIYDILGKEIYSTTRNYSSTGRHKLAWNGKKNDGTEVSAGMYLAKVEHHGSVQILKMMFLR